VPLPVSSSYSQTRAHDTPLASWAAVASLGVGAFAWAGRIVIDANNPIERPLFQPAELNGRMSTEVFADLVPGARVVKAFNHLPPHLLSGDPRAEGGSFRTDYAVMDARPAQRENRPGDDWKVTGDFTFGMAFPSTHSVG
jgi:hypothetical protein